VVRRTALRWLLGILAGIPGCDSPFVPESDIEVRIANLTAFPFARVNVQFPENAVNYGTVPAHGLTDYQRVSKAYRYAYIEVQVGGEERRIQPIDYVGERVLGPGRYTYALNLTVEGNLTLHFQED
jgi:hypothetical protein